MDYKIINRYCSIFIILIIILGSCGQSAEERAKNGTIGQPHALGSNGYNYDIITIDSCEYIMTTSELIHKGNCKLCIARQIKLNN